MLMGAPLRYGSAKQIFYTVDASGVKGEYDTLSAEQAIDDAFATWQKATEFTFVKISADRAAEESQNWPVIHCRFGKTNAFHAAETTRTEKGGEVSKPVDMVFNDAVSFVNMRRNIEEMKTSTNFFNNVLVTVQSGFTDDLWTIAMHEIGHALGLEHSGNMNSIMYADVDAAPESYVMRSRSIPAFDLVSLARIYGSGIDAVTVVPEDNNNGYLIVGGKFEINEENSKGISKPDPDAAWGATSHTLVMIGDFYCFNYFMNRRGYGRIYAYLEKPENVTPGIMVAVGGETEVYRSRSAAESNDRSQLSSIHPFYQCGSGERQLFAHYEAWNATAKHDGYAKSYFRLKEYEPGRTAALKVSGGYKTIGTASGKNQYSVHSWGSKGRRNLRPIAEGRLWPVGSPKSADYHNAYGTVYLDFLM